jgi:hypothetical protein
MRGLIVGALAISMGGTAWADCVPKPSKADSFGVARLGGMTDARMSRLAKRDPGCDYKSDPSCGYTDANGITYAVVEDELEAKTITIATLKPGVPLPFGLSRAETVASVRAKVASRLPAPLIGSNGDLSTDLCLRDPGSTGAFEFWFHFDARGRLLSLGTRVPGVRD